MAAILEVNNLSKKFGRKQVLKNISMTVNSGEVLGFLGPNGAGKTTAIKVILGFLSDDGGSVMICGHDTNKDYEAAMGCVGAIVENPDMYKQYSGMFNLELYARAHGKFDKQAIMEAVKSVGLENRINDKVKKYSLGMKQRLGVALAMITKPKLLILDEPTNGLDPAGIKELRDILKKLAHEDGVAVLVSSHQLAEMQLMCDRVLIISNGQVLAEKNVSELGDSLEGKAHYFIEVNDVKAAKDVISEIDSISIIDNEEKPNGITINAFKNAIPSIVNCLVNKGVDIYEIRHEGESLENVFMEVTGGVNIID